MSDTLIKKKLPFGSAPNTLLYDTELSLKAKGLYVFMEAKPEGWNFTASSMAKQLKESRKTILLIMQELKKHEWITYKKNKNGSGVYELQNGAIDIPQETVKSTEITEDNPKSQKGTMAVESQSPIPTRCQIDTVSKGDCISKKDYLSKKDINIKKDTHTAQARTQSEIIDLFIPNDSSANKLREAYPNISNRQAQDMIEAFKDKMIERTSTRGAPWKDIQAQFRSYVRKKYITPLVIDTTDDSMKSNIGYAGFAKIIQANKDDLKKKKAKGVNVSNLIEQMRVV